MALILLGRQAWWMVAAGYCSMMIGLVLPVSLIDYGLILCYLVLLDDFLNIDGIMVGNEGKPLKAVRCVLCVGDLLLRMQTQMEAKFVLVWGIAEAGDGTRGDQACDVDNKEDDKGVFGNDDSEVYANLDQNDCIHVKKCENLDSDVHDDKVNDCSNGDNDKTSGVITLLTLGILLHMKKK
ncbi:hypothetical protein Tco_1011646 [Tanacetum coccineum]